MYTKPNKIILKANIKYCGGGNTNVKFTFH